MRYQQVTSEERCTLATLRRQQRSKTAIAGSCAGIRARLLESSDGIASTLMATPSIDRDYAIVRLTETEHVWQPIIWGGDLSV